MADRCGSVRSERATVLGWLRRNDATTPAAATHSCRHPRRTSGRAHGTDDSQTRLDQSRINSDHSDRDSTAARSSTSAIRGRSGNVPSRRPCAGARSPGAVHLRGRHVRVHLRRPGRPVVVAARRRRARQVALVRRRRARRRRSERRRRRRSATASTARAGEEAWLAAGRAVQLVEWAPHPPLLRPLRHADRAGVRASGRCAARRAASTAFPRLAPAMITLVTRGDDGPDQEALLARGVQWTVPMYSCLAGFVEPGESLEEAVGARGPARRSGVTVGDVRYQGSQPWPFPHSLMIGFRARYVSGEIVLDDDRDRRRQLVPPRRPADDPARHLDRPQADRRLASPRADDTLSTATRPDDGATFRTRSCSSALARNLRRGGSFSVKQSRMISARIRRCTGEPERDSSWFSPGKR